MKKNYFIISGILFVLLGIAALCWLKTQDLHDFGLNFFTELLGVIVTVAIVEKLLSNQKYIDRLPVKQAMHREVQLFTSRFIFFWEEVYRASVDEQDPNTIDELFSKDTFGKILLHLDLNKPANIIPKMNFFAYFNMNCDDFSQRINQILNRYNSDLDPHAYGYLYKILEDIVFHMKNVDIIHNHDIRGNIPRPTHLQAYFPELKNESFETIRNLCKWCEETRMNLEKVGATGLYKVSVCPHPEKQEPWARLTDDELKAQIEKFQNGNE